MGSRFCSTTLIAILTAPAAFNADPQPKPVPTINVRVYDYAQLTRGTLKQAQREVRWILQKAGLECTWHQCVVPGRKRESGSECKTRRTPTDLVVRILPRRMARRLSMERDVYGSAATGRDGAFASLADVFYHPIEELAKRRGKPTSLLLASFLTHEIGHLLLGPDSHSESGIMHVPFDEAQLERAVLGCLLFTPAEAARIRSEAMKRMVFAGRIAPAFGETTPLPVEHVPMIPICVLDYAGVPEPVLERARRVANRIFQEAGVMLDWLPAANLSANTISCDCPTGPAVLFLRLIPHFLAETLPTYKTRFGFALLTRSSGYPSNAYVFVDKVKEFAVSQATPTAILLGHVLAHELGHLLLGTNSHSQSGIMRSYWGPEATKKIKTCGLFFLRTEAERIQANLEERETY